MQTNVTDEEIVEVFKRTNFGNRNHRNLLEQGCLKSACGYSSGHTLTMILRQLGLTTKDDRITKKGKEFMFAAFYSEKEAG